MHAEPSGIAAAAVGSVSTRAHCSEKVTRTSGLHSGLISTCWTFRVERSCQFAICSTKPRILKQLRMHVEKRIGRVPGNTADYDSYLALATLYHHHDHAHCPYRAYTYKCSLQNAAYAKCSLTTWIKYDAWILIQFRSR